jgi:hypothetical protein
MAGFLSHLYSVISSSTCIIQGAYKLSEYFAKPYFHKYWTEIHDVTTIWKMNVCSFIVTLNAFDVCPIFDMADVEAILPFLPNPLKHVLCDVPNWCTFTILVVSLEVVGRLRRTMMPKLLSECALNCHKTVTSRKFQDTPTTLSRWGSSFLPTLIYTFSMRWQ